MASYIPLDFTQPDNKLSAIAEEQRKKNKAINDYKDANVYSSTNPDAIADGDDKGRGTGAFLDANNYAAGTILDITKRKEAFAGLKYKPTSPYSIPT